MHTVMTNLSSLWEVVLAALVFGAGVPAVFAFAVRWWGRAETVDAEGNVQRNHVALAGALLCVIVIVVVVISAILFTAKAFIAHQFGIHLFGQA
ncbi:hypothetical protein [Nocardia asteroides]|uniref:Uncharacterized protein n=1 Tax=Nocardia asteroides NBRC 15531 TaxID=1110697 RepID=U5E439_NOCAS|nr:hypothetical protein [Nocardia asteroides]TLF69554.1 hypothetical protein FEK33_04490 [Nocardia asteroides NBRC 15531]UGT49058.1 hypothetical protein LT345_32340 [Nocardia asteroides]SFL78913.1 hypothetical protein SAMN05444423_101914 [Nocardia asteroides]VEG31166.1 Uncharacterised protein [Nocardia asteroides]GAD83612.1 hypothetical protein NCAST_20_01800 [Nocardia asteroides NBRC 15531]